MPYSCYVVCTDCGHVVLQTKPERERESSRQLFPLSRTTQKFCFLLQRRRKKRAAWHGMASQRRIDITIGEWDPGVLYFEGPFPHIGSRIRCARCFSALGDGKRKLLSWHDDLVLSKDSGPRLHLLLLDVERLGENKKICKSLLVQIINVFLFWTFLDIWLS